MDKLRPHIHAFIQPVDDWGYSSHKKYFSSFHKVAMDSHGMILSPQGIKDLPVQGYMCGMNGWYLSKIEILGGRNCVGTQRPGSLWV